MCLHCDSWENPDKQFHLRPRATRNSITLLQQLYYYGFLSLVNSADIFADPNRISFIICQHQVHNRYDNNYQQLFHWDIRLLWKALLKVCYINTQFLRDSCQWVQGVQGSMILLDFALTGLVTVLSVGMRLTFCWSYTNCVATSQRQRWNVRSIW